MSKSKLICNLSDKDLFRLTDDETDAVLYPQIWYRTKFSIKQDGKRKIECHQVDGLKLIDFLPAQQRVYLVDQKGA